MVRYTLFVLTVLGSAATAVAAIQPAPSDITGKNVTVIEKNQFWSDLNAAEFKACAKEDCSDTPQG
jgi:hypothetical protein